MLPMIDLSPDRQNKFKAYRARKKAAGLREVRMWVPDLRSAAFEKQSRLEAEALKRSSSEEDTMRWIEASQAEDAGMWD